MIKLTLGEVVVADRVLREFDELDLCVKASHAIDKITRHTEKDAAFFKKNHTALLTELGEERAATTMELAAGLPEKVLALLPQHEEEFIRRIREIEELPVDLDIEPLDLEILGEIKIKPRQVRQIRPLLVK
jgi:hypothetical protein